MMHWCRWRKCAPHKRQRLIIDTQTPSCNAIHHFWIRNYVVIMIFQTQQTIVLVCCVLNFRSIRCVLNRLNVQLRLTHHPLMCNFTSDTHLDDAEGAIVNSSTVTNVVFSHLENNCVCFLCFPLFNCCCALLAVANDPPALSQRRLHASDHRVLLLEH